MAVPAQSTKSDTKAHAQAVAKAAEYFTFLAKRGELPLTEAEFDARVKGFYEGLEARLELSNALLMAYLQDQPCPQALFRPWASAATIWQWRNTEKNPLPAVTLNGKVMIKPSDFFAALALHGEEKV